MDYISVVIAVVISGLVTFALTVVTTYKLVMYKVDENKAETETLKLEVKAIDIKYNNHNREIGEMKQLLTTTNQLVTQIHAKMFHEKI